MPEFELEKVFLGGGGGGDLFDLSDPCLVKLSVAADLMAVLEDAGLIDFSNKGFGSLSDPFLAGLSTRDSSAKHIIQTKSAK